MAIREFIADNSLAVFVGMLIGFAAFVIISFVQYWIETIAAAIKNRYEDE